MPPISATSFGIAVIVALVVGWLLIALPAFVAVWQLWRWRK